MARRVLEFKSFDENDAEFGARIGISPQAVSNWRNGHSNVGIGVLTALYHKTTACMNWVLTGEGDMDRETPTDAQVELTLREAAAQEAIDLIGAAKEVLESGEPAGRAIGPVGEAVSAARRGKRSSGIASARQAESLRDKKRTQENGDDPE